jgi:N-acetyl-anhydromuramyl-L-alanine amidase AmpD
MKISEYTLFLVIIICFSLFVFLVLGNKEEEPIQEAPIIEEEILEQEPIIEEEEIEEPEEQPIIEEEEIEEPEEQPIIEESKAFFSIIKRLVDWGHHTPANPRFIDTIVIHSSYDALGTDPFSVEGVLYEYKLYKVSPHYLIDRKGNVYQLVENKDIAYHAGESIMEDKRTNVNDFSIGIELINTKTIPPNEEQYNALFELIEHLSSEYDINYVLGHHHIAPQRKTDPWLFDWEKLNSVLGRT